MLASCAPNEVTIHGASQRHEVQARQIIKEMFQETPDLDISFVPGFAHKTAQGAYWCEENRIRVGLYIPEICIAHTSLVHELMHHKQYLWRGDCSFKDHPETLFGPDGLVSELNTLYIKEFCE